MIDLLAVAQTVVLFATGCIVLWYTLETARLRRTAQRQLESQSQQLAAQLEQIETQIRPFVIFLPDEGRATVTLENIGYGPALNVTMPDVLIHERLPGHPLRLRFPTRIPVLRSQEKVTVTVQSLIGDNDFGDFFSAALSQSSHVMSFAYS